MSTPRKLVKNTRIQPPKSQASTAIITQDQESPDGRAVTKFKDIANPIINQAQYEILYNPTPKHSIKTRTGRGGLSFQYVPYGYVVDRLNKAFGFNWSFELKPVFNGNICMVNISEETTRAKTAVVRNIAVYGELKIRLRDPFSDEGGWIEVIKPGPGSQPWEQGVEFGDALKGAKSDGLKVAAQQLGIGLDLKYDEQGDLAVWNAVQKRKADLDRENSEALSREMERDASLPPSDVNALFRRMEGYGISKQEVYDALALKPDDLVALLQLWLKDSADVWKRCQTLIELNKND